MKNLSMPARLAATSAATALAAAGLVAAGSTTAHAATVTSTYTCSIPALMYVDDFPVTVTGQLPVPQYYADAPVPAGLLSISASAVVPDSAEPLLGAAGVDNASSSDFAFALGSGAAPVSVSGPVTLGSGDVASTWEATGSNAAFRTPKPGVYDILLPSSFSITVSDEAAPRATLNCVIKDGTAPAPLMEDFVLGQQASATTVEPRVIKVRKGRAAKVPVAVTRDVGAPTGKVLAKKGTRQIGAARLDANGAAVIKLDVLKPGEHKVTISYPGNASVTPSKDQVTIKVVR